MMVHKKTILSGIYLLFFITLANAVNPGFSHLTIKDGLSQSTIKSIFQDSRGFMWFGSADGLNKYDAYRLTTYRNIPTDSSTICGNDISCIFENPADSTLWIGTQGDGLNMYNRRNDTFHWFRNNNKVKNPLPANDIRCIVSGPGKKLWFASQGGGVFYFNPADSSFVQPEFSSLSHLKNINAMAFDHKGGLWLGTNYGLYYLKPTLDGIFSGEVPEEIMTANLQSPGILAIMSDRKGNIWIGARNEGLFRYQPASKTMTHFSRDKLTENAMETNTIYCILERKDGAIWIGTDEGLYRYNPLSNDFTSFRNDPTDTESLNDNVIYSLYEDKSGILWVGTFFGGINKIDPEESRFAKFGNFHKLFNLNKAANLVKGIYKDENNTVWVTTSKGLISLNENYFKKPQGNTGATLYFKNIDQSLIFGDSYQNLYLSNANGMFIKKNGSSGFQPFAPGILPNSPKLNQYVFGFEDSDRFIWFLSPYGLFKYSPKTGLAELKTPTMENEATLPGYLITGIESYDGKLWLGAVDGELYQYDRYSNHLRKITPKNIENNAAPYNRIFSICEQTPGFIWFGTNNGLYMYDEKNGSLTSYLSSDGLANNVVYSVIADNKERIWCSTNLGASVFHLENQSFTNYTWEDGLQSNEFNQNAYFKSREGIIYMGGIDGFNMIDPERIIPNEFVPPVVITNLTVYHEPITHFTHPEITNIQINETKEIVLTHKQAIFTFEFSALNFIHSNKNKYRYKLEGYDTGWIDAGSPRTASYTNIYPGKYIFMVQGANNSGIWNPTPTTVKITILPPFWLTWWFMGLVAVAMLVALYLVFYLRLRSVRQKAAILQKLVAKKTAALSEKNKQIEFQNVELLRINDEIKNRNEKIEQKNKRLNEQNEQIVKQRDNLLALAEQVQEANRAKINFFTTISHEFRTPLTLIIGPLKELITHIDELSKNELQRKFKIIYGNASKLLLLVNELLDFRKVDTDNAGLERSVVDFVLFIPQVAFLFNDIAQRKKIIFRFVSAQKTLEVLVDAEKMEKILFNLISNAFKFTPDEGEITVSIDRIGKPNEKGRFRITVSDSGQGIAGDQLPHIFETFYQADYSRNLQQPGSGLGLALVKKYVELHGGTVEVASKPGKGTVFTITVPIVTGENEQNRNAANPANQIHSNKEILIASIDEYSPILLRDIKTGEEHNFPRLLLVEDDNNLRAYLKEILSANYRIEEAADAGSGIKLADTKHPDLIVCDVMLPDINGFEFCRRVKEEFKTSHLPVILLTALADMPNQLSGLKSGADAYITKPFDLQYLLLTIENLIRQRRKMQAKFYKGINLDTTGYTPNLEDQNFLSKVIGEIEKNITDSSFDVEMLCKAINLSQPQAWRKIKALTDLTVTEFIRNIRIKKGAQLLASGNLTISEVAYQVGFSDPNYFSRCFAKVYGQTPTEFIKLGK